MSILIRVITTCWPFIKEILFKDQATKEFLHENKWQIGQAVFTLVLFFLFINLFTVVVEKDRALYKLETDKDTMLQRQTHNDERVLELKLRIEELETDLTVCRPTGRKPPEKPPEKPSSNESSQGAPDYLEELEDLRAQDQV